MSSLGAVNISSTESKGRSAAACVMIKYTNHSIQRIGTERAREEVHGFADETPIMACVLTLLKPDPRSLYFRHTAQHAVKNSKESGSGRFYFLRRGKGVERARGREALVGGLTSKWLLLPGHMCAVHQWDTPAAAAALFFYCYLNLRREKERRARQCLHRAPACSPSLLVTYTLGAIYRTGMMPAGCLEA